MLKEEKTTVRAIASRLGLSPATVSLALNGRRPAGYVSTATRRQVWRAAEEMGYPLTRLRSRRPPLERAGIFTNGQNMVYARSILEMTSALNRSGVQLIIHSVASQEDSGNVAREMFRRQEIDAAVFVGSRHNNGEPVTSASFDDMPLVVIGDLPDGSNVWQVTADNEGGGRAIGQHLLELGHRSVAMLFPQTDTLVAMRRLKGLRSVWQENGESTDGLQFVRTNTGQNSLVEESVTEFVQQNRASSSPATALFCFNDWMAAMAVNALRRCGVRLPDELSVAGFDDELYASLIDPPLTTIHQPFDQLGQIAADMLLRQVSSPGSSPEVRLVPCTLMVRGSTTAPVA